MKNRVSKTFIAIGDAICAAIKSFPVETGIILYAFVFGVLLIEDAVTGNEEAIALAPLFFALAYSLNNLIKCPRGRWAYYLCWLPIVPLWFVDMESWVESSGYVVALACAFLAFLVCRKACDNRRFADESFNYLFDLALAFFFSGIAHLLLMAIYLSTAYIFGLDHDIIPDFLEYTSLVAYVVFTPLLFLSFVRNNMDRGFLPNRFFDVLMNFILTPALLVYTAILYIYFAKILFTWSLPEGGVAVMVFVFTLIAVLVKAWQPLLGRRYYDRFFDNFSLVSLPAVAMFWVGSIYRIAQYGFTEWRFYLVLCGVIMTFTLAMFACRGRGKYITVALVSMGLLALFTFIPPLSAKNLSNVSQARIVEKSARRIGLLDADGNISPQARPVSDTVHREDYHRMYESLRYLNKHEKPIYGLDSPDDIKDIFPWEWSEPGEAESENPILPLHIAAREAVDISGFSKIYETTGWRSDNYEYHHISGDDSLTVYRRTQQPQIEQEHSSAAVDENERWERIFSAGFDEVKTRLLAAASPMPEWGLTTEFLEKQKNNPGFFIYDTDDMRLVFDDITWREEDGEWKITYLSVKYILIK